MTRLNRRAALGAALTLALAPTARAQVAPEARGGDVAAGALRITRPWTRAAGQGGTGAGYMTIRNAGPAPDRIVAARAAVARTVELHTHIRDGDVMRMRPVPAIDIPAGGTVQLAPGGLHIMLIGLAAPLRQGERVPLILVFERAGEVQVQLAVEAAGARGHGGHSH